MNTTIRRLTVALAATATAATGAVLAAPAAQAANPTGCVNELTTNISGYTTHVAPTDGTLMVDSWGSKTACDGLRVSFGVSRTDTSSHRSQNAPRVINGVESVRVHATKFGFRPADAGSWMTRQIAVGDAAGRVTVRTFSAATSPYKFTVKRATVLTSNQSGTLKLNAMGYTDVSGALKVYNDAGGLNPLAGQQVQLQVRRPGQTAYSTRCPRTTSSIGGFFISCWLEHDRGADVRLAYVTPYQTFASSFTYVGRVQS